MFVASMPIRFARIGIAVLLAFAMAAGCAQQPAAAPPVERQAAASAHSPREVVSQFRAALISGMVPAARFQIDEISHGTPAGDFYRQRISRLSAEMAGGGFDFKPVEESTRQDCAVVIVQENPSRGGPAQYSAIWLIRREVGWKISPEPWNYQRIAGLAAAQLATFQSLDQWCQIRRGELKAEHLK